METIGARLKAAREKLNLSREDVAKATKLKAFYIESIENNDFQRLIAPIYAKGFIRLYAQCVRLDPQPLLRQFAALDLAVTPAPAGPEKTARKPAPRAKNGWNPGAYAKILLGACRKIRLPSVGKIKIPAIRPLPAPVVKRIAVAVAAAAGVVVLTVLVQKASFRRPPLNVSPACRWVADPPEPYLDVTVRPAAGKR